MAYSLFSPSYIENRSVTVGAAGREKIVVVRFAVRVALTLEKVPGSKLLVAVRAGEVLRVPCFTQGSDNL